MYYTLRLLFPLPSSKTGGTQRHELRRLDTGLQWTIVRRADAAAASADCARHTSPRGSRPVHDGRCRCYPRLPHATPAVSRASRGAGPRATVPGGGRPGRRRGLGRFVLPCADLRRTLQLVRCANSRRQTATPAAVQHAYIPLPLQSTANWLANDRTRGAARRHTTALAVGGKRRSQALMVDVVSRVLFPIMFVIFNIIYWPIYLM